MKNLQAIFIVLVMLSSACFSTLSHAKEKFEYGLTTEETANLLPGKNEIKSVTITNEGGLYYANIEYFWRGDPYHPEVMVMAADYNFPADHNPEESNDFTSGAPAVKGLNKVKLLIARNPSYPDLKVTSKSIVVALGHLGMKTTDVDNIKIGFNKITSDTYKKITYPIAWPDYQTFIAKEELSRTSVDELYSKVVDILNDPNGDLDEAKLNLDRIILKSPNYVGAYHEYARYALSASKNSEEGLEQARNYITSGLAIDSKYADLYVLLGYVCTKQKKLNEANLAFERAKKLNTKNTWLWTHWGSMYESSGNLTKAKEFYSKVLASPRAYDRYDNARLKAYEYQISLLDPKRDAGKINELHSKRVEEYKSTVPCFFSEYARFKLNTGDITKAMMLAKEAVNSGCEGEYGRYTLALTYYYAWYFEQQPKRSFYLAQARSVTPQSASLYYNLATTDDGAKVIKALLNDGGSLDILDSHKYSALAISLWRNDLEAASRLLDLNADAFKLIDKANYPVALMPIFNGNVEALKLLISKNVDFNKVSYNKMSALALAKELGNPDIVLILTKYHKSKT